MGRISGALNHDHEAKRLKLASALASVILAAQGKHLSLKELASAVKVDPGTLRHYFDDRAGAVRAAFESLLPHGEVQKARAAELAQLPAKKGLTTLLERIIAAWPHALGGMHAAGFVEGMTDPELGQAYVSTMLEPTIDAVERLLVAYHARGELQVPEARVGALALLSPVLIALFHQHQLSGRRCRPLDFTSFLPAHLEAFFRGYAPKRPLA